MQHTFQDLGLIPDLLDTLDELGYTEPTPIQAQAIPPLLAGQDVMGQSQTGTGKTAAFTLPLVQQIDSDALQMLVLTPTRELANQVAKNVHKYGSKLNLRVLPIYGQQSYGRQIKRLKKGVNVVVGTPGRTRDLIQKGALKLHDVRFLVLDEADEMLKMGFADDIEAIIGATNADKRQTVLFSATLPKGIQKLASKYMRDPLRIAVEASAMTVNNVTQRYYLVRHHDRLAALCRLLETEDVQNTLIFARTRAGTARLAEQLTAQGYPAAAIHGDLAQNERERILGRFRSGQYTILVGTDVVARGVDVPQVSHVINYNIPQQPDEYVHRIGRTGRAGRDGDAITLITAKERGRLKRIEKHTNAPIEKATLPSREDVMEQRKDAFRERVVAQIDKQAEDGSDALLTALMDDGHSAEQVARAALYLLHTEEDKSSPDKIQTVSETSGRSQGHSNHRNGKRGRRRSKRSHESGMTRLHMNIGKNKGVRPGDVVYNVAKQANIPGKSIGAISIFQDETFVDVPNTHVDQVLSNNRCEIRGQQVTLIKK